MLTTQAYASEVQVAASTKPMAAFTEADMQALFGVPDQPMQLAALSQQEMMETVGAFVPLVYGGLVAANYAWTAFRVSGLAVGAYRVIGPAYKGGRIIQTMKNNVPNFRLDNHSNPYTSNLHMHFGNMKLHRPWYAPWSGR